MSKQDFNIWWGPPKKFSALIAERKITWLELFYDLVYVIVISKVTHTLAHHPSALGLLDYAYMFTMIFWGWYNGSIHHDLHGTPGIRTRFMTLWQMVAVGALAVTLDSPPESLMFRATIALLFMQLFITYLWWSVGIYDKQHRKLNVPYTVSFLVSFALLIVTLFVPSPYKRILFWIALGLNYLPYIITANRLRNKPYDLSLSANMTERLGLFAIIVFGEAILGVINSVSHAEKLSVNIWFCFVLGVLIVFALWWIFFAVIADRECKKGMIAGNALSMIYIPTLASLGMIGASFPALMGEHDAGHSELTDNAHIPQIIFGVSVAIFLCCIAALSRYLHFTHHYEKYKKQNQLFIVTVGIVNLLLMLLYSKVPALIYLLLVFGSLLWVVVVFTRRWFRTERERMGEGAEEMM